MKPLSAIFHIDGEEGLRGGERQLLYLAAGLRARGRRNVIYARETGQLSAQARRLGFETRALPFAFEWDPFSAIALAKAALKECAIIHSHTGHAAGLGAMASLAGVPFIAHRRVDFPVGRISAKFKYGRAQKTVAVSTAIARLLRDAGLPDERVAVVHDGLPINDEEATWMQSQNHRYNPALKLRREQLRRDLGEEFALDPKTLWIGNLAALVPHKDHDTLIAAAVIVLLKNPHARFIIAGEGPQGKRLQDSVRRMGLQTKILFVGQREDSLSLLQSLDVYVQSSWGEGMGSVLIEAAACGVPIVATVAGGIPEVVDDQETGLLVRPRDPEALAAALERLIHEPILAKRLATQGLQRITRHGLTRMAKEMEDIYDQLS